MVSGYWRDNRYCGIFDEHGNHQRDYCGSLTIVYRHDNSGDGDIVIAEAFCGAEMENVVLHIKDVFNIIMMEFGMRDKIIIQ